MPRFSVTIPAYNAEQTLEETLDSVRSQTYADWEAVVVDDGSTDGTRALAERIAREEPRIRVVTQENRGSGGAYNTAVRNARSDLLVMLSADDLLLPGHLAAFDVLFAEHPDGSIFTCDGWYLHDDDSRERVYPARRWSDPSGSTLEELLRACFYGTGAVYRRNVYDTVGGFREEFYAEDYLFWLLAFAHGFVHRHLDEPLSIHRRGRTQKSHDAVRMRQTDIRVIEALIESGLLDEDSLRAAQRSGARHRRNVALRVAAARVLGQGPTESVLRAVQRVRSRGQKG